MGTQKTTRREEARTTRGAKQPTKGRRFTAEEKERALALLGEGMSPSEVAGAIGTSVTSLKRWEAAMESPPKGKAAKRVLKASVVYVPAFVALLLADWFI